MPGFGDALKAQLPSLVFGLLAGRTGGLPALSALQGGMAQRRDQDYERQQVEQAQAQAQDRQAQLDEERRQQQAAIEGRAQRDDTRADENQQLQKLQAALAILGKYEQQQGETAPDPAAAENAIMGRASGLEGMFSLPQGQLSSAVPNMAPAISSRKKRQAQELYTQAEKLYGPEAMAGDSVTLQTGELFGDMKPSQLRALFATPAITATGEQARPMVAKPDVPNTPEEKFYQRFATELGKKTFDDLTTREQAAARRQWMQADDRQPVGPRDTGDPGPLETIIGPDGKAIRVARKDAIGKPPAAGTEKASSGLQKRVLNFFNRAQQADRDLEAMEPEIEKLGLAGQARQAMAPNVLQTQLGQSYTAAQRAFTEARLRKDSGAAIPPHEFESDRRTYFVQPGDTTTTIRNKNRARAAMLASLGFESGQALGEFVGDADEARSIVDGYKARASGTRSPGAVEEWIRDATGALVKKGAQ